MDTAPFDSAIIAVPAEQVVTLIEANRPDWLEKARATPSNPCWTVTAAFSAPLATEHDRLTDNGLIASAVRNSAKPGRADIEA